MRILASLWRGNTCECASESPRKALERAVVKGRDKVTRGVILWLPIRKGDSVLSDVQCSPTGIENFEDVVVTEALAIQRVTGQGLVVRVSELQGTPMIELKERI
jgi:hypothetical protein